MSAFAISKWFIWPLLRIFIRKIDGIKNIPKGPCVVVCNHASLIDGVILTFLFAWHKKRLRSILTKKHFNNWFWNLVLVKWGKAIRVNGSVHEAIKALKKGDYIVIFPEGKRTYTGKIGKVKHTGSGMLALLTKKSILPVAMNTFNWWNRHHKFPNFKRNIKIIIGKPKKYNLKSTKANAKKVTDAVMKEVKKLKCMIS